MRAGLVHSIKDSPRPPPQRLPKKIVLLYTLHADAHRRSQSAGFAIPAGWCPTSSGPAASRDVSVPAAAFFLATHLMARAMQPAYLRAVAKQEECMQYSELNVNNAASKHDGWSSRSCIQRSQGKLCMLGQTLDRTNNINAAGGVSEKEKKIKDYAFRRQFDEKPSIILGCPV